MLFHHHDHLLSPFTDDKKQSQVTCPKKRKNVAFARIPSRVIVLCFWKEHSYHSPGVGNEITEITFPPEPNTITYKFTLKKNK